MEKDIVMPNIIKEKFKNMKPSARNCLIYAAILFATVGGLFILIKGITFVSPFIVALLLSAIMEPLIKFLVKRCKLNRSVSAAIGMLIIVGVVGLILGLGIAKAIAELQGFASNLPDIFNKLMLTFNVWIADMDNKTTLLPTDVINAVRDMITNSIKNLSSMSTAMLRGVWNTATFLPQAVVYIIVVLISTFFMMRDRNKIADAFNDQIPASWIKRIRVIKSDLFSALFGYIKAMLILMLLTFCELLLGFSILGVEYALLLAIVISIMDALPVLGSGTFIIPWAVYNLAIGEVRLAIGLAILYCVVWIIRQVVEPRVVSGQIGLHPLQTLLAMYIGLRLIGVFGMILGPIALLTINSIMAAYTMGKSFKEMVEVEEEPLIDAANKTHD